MVDYSARQKYCRDRLPTCDTLGPALRRPHRFLGEAQFRALIGTRMLDPPDEPVATILLASAVHYLSGIVIFSSGSQYHIHVLRNVSVIEEENKEKKKVEEEEECEESVPGKWS